MKYYNSVIGFLEIPDEVTLCINISNCPIHCEECHSKWLWKDVGQELNINTLQDLINKNKGVSCVCFMGGDNDPCKINEFAKFIKNSIKVAWYSGLNEIPSCIDIKNFDYIKIGPYIKELGGLDSTNTNQKIYRVNNNNLVCINNKFVNLKEKQV